MRNYAMVNIFVICICDLEATVRHCGPFSLICYLGQRLLRILNRRGQVPTIVFHSNHDGPISHRRPTGHNSRMYQTLWRSDGRQTDRDQSVNIDPCLAMHETVRNRVPGFFYGVWHISLYWYGSAYVCADVYLQSVSKRDPLPQLPLPHRLRNTTLIALLRHRWIQHHLVCDMNQTQ